MSYEIKYRSENEMKDSGIEWIGLIPEEWDIRRLRFLANLDTGNKDTQDKTEDGLYPFYVRSDVIERINSYSYEGESILTAGDGVGVGRVFHYVKGKFAYHQRVYKLSEFKDIQGKYLYYFVMENFHKEVMKLSAKSTVDSLRRPMFNNFPVVLPKISLQQKISNFLDLKMAEFNSIISKKELLITKLEKAKRSLISEVVTGKVKIVDGKLVERKVSEMKDSGIGWLGLVPKSWQYTQFKRYIKINSGREILDESKEIQKPINVYGSGGVFKKTSKILHSGESVLFGRKGTIGKPIYLNEEFWTVDTMYYCTCRKELLPKLLYYQLLVIPWDQVSTHTALPSIVGSDIGNLHTVFPELKEQYEVSNFLDCKIANFNSIIKKNQHLIQKINEAKQSLISEAVTGKIDLREWEIQKI